MPKKYRVIRNGEMVLTTTPGKYAGSRICKIFGRLDCPSGKHKMAPKNRVFFRDWEDAIEAGYRPCRICQPEKIRLNELLSDFHPALENLHVAIYETNPRPHRKTPWVCFYVTLKLDQCDNSKPGKCVLAQADLEEWLPYPAAIARALAWGRQLTLPVIDHFWRADNRVRYLPTGEPTERQLQNRKRIIATKEIKWAAFSSMW